MLKQKLDSAWRQLCDFSRFLVIQSQKVVDTGLFACHVLQNYVDHLPVAMKAAVFLWCYSVSLIHQGIR